MLINRIKIYHQLLDKEMKTQTLKAESTNEFEFLGHSNSTICCIINCSTPLSESKDYKTLTKVFKKLMLNIENVYVININNSKSTNFIHFIHEFDFKKIFIFGEDALMNNIPIRLEKLKPTIYEVKQLLLVENLEKLISTTDEDYKKQCWEAIKSFFKQ